MQYITVYNSVSQTVIPVVPESGSRTVLEKIQISVY